MASASETEAFAQRLKQALEGSGVRSSPTVVANEFNLRTIPLSSEADASFERLDMADREMVHRYLALTVADRKTVREVVTALSIAAIAKKPA